MTKKIDNKNDVNRLKNELDKKINVLKLTSDKKTNKLISWFEELKNIFKNEEEIWLFVTICLFVLLFWMTTKFIVYYSYQYIPSIVLVFTALYFSCFQYTKAKHLRIENQNKVALLHWFQALRAEDWEWVEKALFYDNIANVVFTKVYNKKVSNDLPVDKLIDTVSNLSKIVK